MVETLTLLPGETEGITSAPRSADDDTTMIQFNYNCGGSDEGNTPLFMLGSPKRRKEKPISEDDGLGEALDVLFNDGGILPSNKSNASPLPSLRGDEDDPNNAVDYNGSEDSYLGSLDEVDPTSSAQENPRILSR